MTRANIEKLKTDGPTPVDKLPHRVGVRDKQQGLAVFKFNIKSHSGDIRTPNHTTSIAYLFGEDSREAVAQSWIEANPVFVDRFKKTKFLSSVSSSCGKKWREPFKNAIGESLESETRGGGDTEQSTHFESATEWSE